MHTFLVASVVATGGQSVLGQPSASADKSAYHLFNPTPRQFMRELSTDRPDTTESPYTVDAGHLQIEMSFVDYTREGSTDALAVTPFNIKLGLLNNVDLQAVVDPYVVQSNGERASGVGDSQLRLKVNLWGNDEGQTALALMPFIKLPTASDGLGNDEVEGGLIVPFAMELPDGWGLGLMAEFDAVFDEADDDYDLEFVHTATLGHDIAGRLAGYVEYIGIASTDGDSDYLALLGAGLTYALGEHVQLDAGINFGLTDAADDFNPFVGMSIRF